MNVTLFPEVPPSLLQATMEIEEWSGIPVEVAQADAQLIKEFPSLAKLPLLDIWPDIRRIRIWHPGTSITIPDLSHELIHARRNILQSVPRLIPLNRARHPELIFLLENDLEHLFVLPEEISYFPSQEESWASKYAQYIAEAEPNQFNLFRHWVVINRVLPTQRSLIQQCRFRLVASGLFDAAEQFRSELEMAAADKGELIRAALKWFPYIQNDICVQRYVVANRILASVNAAL